MSNVIREEKVGKINMYMLYCDCIYLLCILGDLCSQCKDDYGISLDLRRCVNDETCGAVGVMIFVLTCKILLSGDVHLLLMSLQFLRLMLCYFFFGCSVF